MATLQAGEYFGERCLRKEWRANMHVIAKGMCMVYTINKFDLVTLLTPPLRAALFEGARFDDLDDDALCDQFQTCAHFADFAILTFCISAATQHLSSVRLTDQ